MVFIFFNIFNTVPAGLTLIIDGVPQVTPFTTGSGIHVIQAPTPQGTLYFDHWECSGGGGGINDPCFVDLFLNPQTVNSIGSNADTTYTAFFVPGGPLPVGLTSICSRITALTEDEEQKLLLQGVKGKAHEPIPPAHPAMFVYYCNYYNIFGQLVIGPGGGPGGGPHPPPGGYFPSPPPGGSIPELVTFFTYGLPFSAGEAILTVDGIPYTANNLPSLTFARNSTHTFAWASPVVDVTVTCLWSSTNGLSSSQGGTFVVPAGGGIVIANYAEQLIGPVKEVIYGGQFRWDKVLPYINNNTKLVMVETDIGDCGTFIPGHCMTQAALATILATKTVVLDVGMDTGPFFPGPAPLLGGATLYNVLAPSGPEADGDTNVVDPAALAILGPTVACIFDYYTDDVSKDAPHTIWCQSGGGPAENWCYRPAGTSIVREVPYDGYWIDIATLNKYQIWMPKSRLIWISLVSSTSAPQHQYDTTKATLAAYATAVGATFLDVS